MALSVIGPGFGRTGTLSLKVALETLGVGRCYHMAEVMQDPDHAGIWSAAADGTEPDWDALFAGFSATVDWPGCHFWRPLVARYPGAKVVLTIRDPERWYQSTHDTIYNVFGSHSSPAGQRFPDQVSMAKKVVGEGAFGGRFGDRAHAIGVYERHNEAVRGEIPADRLLVYRVSEGWEPLCRFLDRPVPDVPFPRANTTEDFNKLQRQFSATTGTPAS